MPSSQVRFDADAAKTYCEKRKWSLPKGIKDDTQLQEIVEELVEAKVKAIKNGKDDEEDFECTDCRSTIFESDSICWYCGADVSEEIEEKVEKPTPKKVEPKKSELKKVDERKAVTIIDRTEDEDEVPKKENKKEAKAEVKKETKVQVVKKEAKQEVLEAKKEEATPHRSLKEYTAELRKLNANAGGHAWHIGKILLEVKETKAYLDEVESLADYVEQVLEMSWQMARNFMRYAELVQEEQAAQLGIFKLELVARSPEEIRPKMLKAALPKQAGGSGLNRNQLEAKLSAEKEKAKIPQAKVGRKAEPNKKMKLSDLIDTTLEGKLTKDGEADVEILGTDCVIEVKVLKSVVRLTFREVEEVEDDE